MAFGRLTRTKGAGATSEQRPRPLPARNKSMPARKRSGSCHSINRAEPGAAWQPPLSTTIASAWGASEGGAAVIWGLKPTPKDLAHQPQGKDPEQQRSGDHWPAPTADKTNHQQDQAEAKGHQDQREEFAEPVSHGCRSGKVSRN